uniref:Uncharacterized protein n=1 Tax=Clandestinovirus TaxID=2831644 RepID=A0A8F8KNZ6_9VIRU|nr:hypothetical protein KOM_12_373 [Clandestinovirus]
MGDDFGGLNHRLVGRILLKTPSWKPLSMVSRKLYKTTMFNVKQLRFYARPERMKAFGVYRNLSSLEFITRMQLVVSDHLNIPSLSRLKIVLETGGSVHWDRRLPNLTDLTILVGYELTDDDHPFTHQIIEPTTLEKQLALEQAEPLPVPDSDWQTTFGHLVGFHCNILEPWALGLKNTYPEPAMEEFGFLPGDYRDIDTHGPDFFRNLLAMLKKTITVKRFGIPIFHSDFFAHITNKMVATVWSWMKNMEDPKVTIDFCLEQPSSMDLIDNYLTPMKEVLQKSTDESRSMVNKLANKNLKTVCSFIHTNVSMTVKNDTITLNSDNLSEISFVQSTPTTTQTTFRIFIRPHTICHDTHYNTIQQVLKEWADKCITFAHNICDQFVLDIVFMSVPASQINTFGEARQWSDNRRQLIYQYASIYDQGYTIPKHFVSDVKITKYAVTMDYNRVIIKSKPIK